MIPRLFFLFSIWQNSLRVVKCQKTMTDSSTRELRLFFVKFPVWVRGKAVRIPWVISFWLCQPIGSTRFPWRKCTKQSIRVSCCSSLRTDYHNYFEKMKLKKKSISLFSLIISCWHPEWCGKAYLLSSEQRKMMINFLSECDAKVYGVEGWMLLCGSWWWGLRWGWRSCFAENWKRNRV